MSAMVRSTRAEGPPPGLLEAFPFVRALSKAGQRTLAEALVERRYAARELVLAEGDACASLLLVEQGQELARCGLEFVDPQGEFGTFVVGGKKFLCFIEAESRLARPFLDHEEPPRGVGGQITAARLVEREIETQQVDVGLKLGAVERRA